MRRAGEEGAACKAAPRPARLIPGARGAHSIPHIRRIEIGGPPVHRRAMMCTRRGASLSPSAQAFFDLVDEMHRQGPQSVRDAI